MRLTKEMIKEISEAVVRSLETRKMARMLKPSEVVSGRVSEIITADLLAEDRLDLEVEKLLSSHEAEIAKGGMDYRKLFEMTKQRLARERGIVI